MGCGFSTPPCWIARILLARPYWNRWPGCCLHAGWMADGKSLRGTGREHTTVPVDGLWGLRAEVRTLPLRPRGIVRR